MKIGDRPQLDAAEVRARVEGPEPSFLIRGRAIEYVVRKLGEYLDPQTSGEPPLSVERLAKTCGK